MSAVLPPRGRFGRAVGRFALFDAWRSVTRREAAAFALLGLALSGIMLLMLADTQLGKLSADRLLAALLDPMLYAMLCLLAWLPADRADAAGVAGVAASTGPAALRARTWRLVAAVLIGSALGASLVPELIRLAGLPDNLVLMWDLKSRPPPPAALRWLGEFLNIALGAGLLVAVLEMRRRRQATEDAVQRALNEHATMSRQALEARLAAMQAHVEPQFLFGALVDVERLYSLSESAGAAQLDRLIGHLRVALPRLRESGSTLGAEAELLASYLAVVQGARQGVRQDEAQGDAQPRLQYGAHIPDTLSDVGFHPMLLLPLVQRALRGDGGSVVSVLLAASADAAHLRVTLTLAGTGLCTDDAELDRVRERLHALYGGQATLDCTAMATALGATSGSTFTITVPR